MTGVRNAAGQDRPQQGRAGRAHSRRQRSRLRRDVEIANVPVNDRFQVVTRHSADEIIYPEEGYLGVRYSRELIIIQVTWVGGRSTDVKKQFYRRIADAVHAKAGVRKGDVWINLVDDAREDWSFGNGDMQYAPK
jgi:4-oxalocrotonate tautomerase